MLPWDAVILCGFVLAFSAMVCAIFALYFAVGWSGVLVTKKEFGDLVGFLVTKLIGLIVVSLVTFVAGLFLGRITKWLALVMSILGALLFTGYILYDTSVILHKLGPGDCDTAVFMLCTDVSLRHRCLNARANILNPKIVNLFIYVLNTFQGSMVAARVHTELVFFPVEAWFSP